MKTYQHNHPLARRLAAGCAAGIAASLVFVAPSAAAPHQAPVPVLSQVVGADQIDTKYADFGGASTPLGQPRGDAFAVGDGAGRNYDGGAIYYSPETGAKVMYGVILERYRAAFGGPAGEVGFPTTDESELPNNAGRYNDFATPGGGTMYWTPTNGAWFVRGPILAAYKQLGGLTGPLGAPTADQTGSLGATVTQRFNGENGTAQISWSPSTGFSTVPATLAAQLVDVKVPNPDTPMPEGAVTQPDGSLSYPDGSVKMPDGTITLPDGNVVLPDGTLQLPDGSVHLPDGATRLPDGSLRMANGVVRLPDGSFQLPEGAVQLPDGMLQLADGTIMYPSGATRAPDGTYALPRPGAQLSGPRAVATDDSTTGTEFPWRWVLPLLVALALLALLAGLIWWLLRRRRTPRDQEVQLATAQPTAVVPGPRSYPEVDLPDQDDVVHNRIDADHESFDWRTGAMVATAGAAGLGAAGLGRKIGDGNNPDTDLTVNGPEVNVPDVNVPGVDVPGVDVPGVDVPEVDVAAVAVEVDAPDVDPSTPEVAVDGPDIEVHAPDMHAGDTGIGWRTGAIGGALAAGAVGAAGLGRKLAHDRHEADIDTPEVTIDAANVDVDPPGVDLSAPGVHLNAPDVTADGPDIDVHAPEIDIASPDIHGPENGIGWRPGAISGALAGGAAGLGRTLTGDSGTEPPTPDVELTGPDVDTGHSGIGWKAGAAITAGMAGAAGLGRKLAHNRHDAEADGTTDPEALPADDTARYSEPAYSEPVHSEPVAESPDTGSLDTGSLDTGSLDTDERGLGWKVGALGAAAAVGAAGAAAIGKRLTGDRTHRDASEDDPTQAPTQATEAGTDEPTPEGPAVVAAGEIYPGPDQADDSGGLGISTVDESGMVMVVERLPEREDRPTPSPRTDDAAEKFSVFDEPEKPRRPEKHPATEAKTGATDATDSDNTDVDNTDVDNTVEQDAIDKGDTAIDRTADVTATEATAAETTPSGASPAAVTPAPLGGSEHGTDWRARAAELGAVARERAKDAREELARRGQNTSARSTGGRGGTWRQRLSEAAVAGAAGAERLSKRVRERLEHDDDHNHNPDQPAAGLTSGAALPAGAHRPLADGTQPVGFSIKGNSDSMLYHLPGTRFYTATVAEIWFATAADAEAAGYRLPPSQRDGAGQA